MSDEFDGYSFYSDGINLYTVPKLESGTGFRASLGFRRPRYGAEVSYTTTTHDTKWHDIRDRARHHEIGADVKYWLVPDGVLQPYGTAGLMLHFLVLKNGAIDLVPDTLVTVRENYNGGIGLRFKGGIRIRITQSVALRSEAAFRIGRFRTLSGRAINAIAASGWVFSAGLVYTFEK